MTAAEARQLLGLSCTFTKKELQSAYAREAKRHHPEEDPEGFARIRSAYTLLLKDAEGVEAAYSGPDSSRDDEGDFSGQRERTELADDGGGDGEEYDFEEIIGRAEKDEAAREEHLSEQLRAVEEGEIFADAGQMRDFLEKADAGTARDPQFLEALCKKINWRFLTNLGSGKAGQVKREKLKNASLDLLIRYYGFDRGAEVFESEEEKRLYRMLDSYRGVHARRGEYRRFGFTAVLICAGTLLAMATEGGAELLPGTLAVTMFFLAMYGFLYLVLLREMVPGLKAAAAFYIAYFFLVFGFGVHASEENGMLVYYTSLAGGTGLWMIAYPTVHIVMKIVKGVRRRMTR